AQRSSATRRQPSAARRCSVTWRVLSRMLSLKPGSRVWISAMSRGTKAATRNSGSPPVEFSAAKAAALATAASGTANGLILIGASQYPAFLQHRRTELQAMRKDRAFRLGYGYFTELHGRSVTRLPSLGVPAKAGTHRAVARAFEPWVPAFAGTPG